MPDSVDREKYEPLREFLDALPTSDRETRLSFDQGEQIIGDTLPPPRPPRMVVQPRGRISCAALPAAGFKVDKVDLAKRIVRFKRIGSPAMRKTLRGSNSLGETDLDTLRFHEVEQPFAVAAHVAIDFGQRRKFFAFGLADILSRDLRPSLCALDEFRL